MTKKYYWLKLSVDFFEREEIRLIENMPNGKDYIIFYMKLLLKSVNSDGKLLFKNVIPYTDDMLSTITGTNIDVVRGAVSLFLRLGLMQKLDDGALFMLETQNMIGHETEWARKKREYREKKKIEALEDKRTKKDNVLIDKKTEKDNVRQEIEKEEEKEIEKDIDIEIEKEEEIEREKEKTLSHAHSDEFKQLYIEFLKKVAKATSTTFLYVKQSLPHAMIIDNFNEYIAEFEKSDFLQGLKENKPVLKNFKSVERVLAGAYRNYNKKTDTPVAADTSYYNDENDIDDIL